MREEVERALQAVRAVATRLPRRRLLAGLAAALLLFTLVLRYLAVDVIQVNWDEFNFLRSVYVTARGEQTQALQTAHGHLFSWLTWLGGNELDQIIRARRAMFALGLVTAAGLGLVGWRLIGGSAGLFAAFVYGAFGYTLRHGTAFRYDSILVACFLGGAAALLVIRRPRLAGAIAGGLAALAAMISIKSVFLIAPLGLVAALPLLEPDDRRRDLERLASFAVSTVALFAVFYGLHRLSLADVDVASSAQVASAADKVIDLDKPLPKAGALIATLRWDTAHWLLIAIGLLFAGGELHRRERRVRALQVLALASPLATIYFYRNSYPYYYVTVLAGVSLVAGYVWHRLELSGRPLVAFALAAVCAVPVARSAWRWYAHNSEDATVDQRKLIATVHAMFPEPVPYIDRCGMISSFEKVGPFMSSWGMSAYRRGRADLFPGLLREKRPRFLLANSPALALSRPIKHIPRGYRWRSGDRDQLRENFVHLWGPIWIAGKSLSLAAGQRVETEIYVPGEYAVGTRTPVEIDGRLQQPGSVVDLAAGPHTLRNPGPGDAAIELRWNPALERPRGKWKTEFKFKGLGLDVPP